MSRTDNEALAAPAATVEVPRPACARCEDWTTVVVMNIEFPCPVCRPEKFQAWHDGNGRIPGAARAAA